MVPNEYQNQKELEEEWKAFFSSGIRHLKTGDFSAGLKDFNKVETMYKNTECSLLDLYIGECYAGIGEFDTASKYYEKRIPNSHFKLNGILRELALKNQVPVIDTSAIFKAYAKNGIVGYENYFVDQVHMTLEGYKLIAASLAEFIQKQGFIEDENLPKKKKQIGPFIDSIEIDDSTIPYAKDEGFTSMAWASFHQGKLEDALKFAKIALSHNSEYILTHLYLGYIYSKWETWTWPKIIGKNWFSYTNPKFKKVRFV